MPSKFSKNISIPQIIELLGDKLTFEERRLFNEKLETGFTIVFIFFISVLTLSLMVYVTSIYSLSGLQEVLSASPETPWGIVTSLFVHSDASHLLNNMTMLFMFLMLLLASNIFLSKTILKKRIRDSFLTVFIVPIMLNFFWIFFFPEVKILGSSGIVYTLEGACLGLSLLNTLEIRRIHSYSQKEKQQLLVSSLSNLAVFIGFLISILVSPTGFLGSKYEAITWFHSVAFCGGFSISVLHPVMCRLR